MDEGVEKRRLTRYFEFVHGGQQLRRPRGRPLAQRDAVVEAHDHGLVERAQVAFEIAGCRGLGLGQVETHASARVDHDGVQHRTGATVESDRARLRHVLNGLAAELPAPHAQRQVSGGQTGTLFGLGVFLGLDAHGHHEQARMSFFGKIGLEPLFFLGRGVGRAIPPRHKKTVRATQSLSMTL